MSELKRTRSGCRWPSARGLHRTAVFVSGRRFGAGPEVCLRVSTPAGGLLFSFAPRLNRTSASAGRGIAGAGKRCGEWCWLHTEAHNFGDGRSIRPPAISEILHNLRGATNASRPVSWSPLAGWVPLPSTTAVTAATRSRCLVGPQGVVDLGVFHRSLDRTATVGAILRPGRTDADGGTGRRGKSRRAARRQRSVALRGGRVTPRFCPGGADSDARPNPYWPARHARVSRQTDPEATGQCTCRTRYRDRHEATCGESGACIVGCNSRPGAFSSPTPTGAR